MSDANGDESFIDTIDVNGTKNSIASDKLNAEEKSKVKKTEWLHVHGCVLMKKDQIKECQITEIADLYNIQCTKVDGRHCTILPQYVKWPRAAEILKDIKDQLEE
jgi:hypothetical protein